MAGSLNVGALNVTFGGDANPLAAAGEKAKSVLTDVASKAKEVVASLDTTTQGMGATGAATDVASTTFRNFAIVGGAVVASLVAVTAWLKTTAEGYAEIGLHARRAQMSTSDFQKAQQALYISGGVSKEKFTEGAEALAKLLTEAAYKENELSKFLDKNVPKWRESKDEIVGTTRGLEIAAELIRRTTSYVDKMEVAKKFGLPKEFVEGLRDGGQAFKDMMDLAGRFGRVIDDDMIKKGEGFERAWRSATSLALGYVKEFVYNSAIALTKLVAGEDGSGSAIAKFFDYFWIRVKNMPSLFSAMMSGENTEEGREKARAAIKKVLDAVDEEFKNSKKSIAEQAKELNDFLNKLLITPPVGKKPGEQGIKGLWDDDKDTKAMERRLDQVRQMIATEDQMLVVQHERYLKELDRFEAAGLEVKEGWDKLKADAEQKFQQKMKDLVFHRLEEGYMTELELLDRRNTEQLRKITEFETNRNITEERAAEIRRRTAVKYAIDQQMIIARQYSALANIVDTTMGNLKDVMGNKGGAAFEIFKAISMATALVKGYEAVVSAYAAGMSVGGPPLAVTFAAIAAAGVAAQIAKIAMTKPGSTGGDTSMAGGGSSAAAAPSGPAPGPASGQTLTVRGINPNQIFSGSTMRDFAEMLIQYQRDGGTIVLARN